MIVLDNELCVEEKNVSYRGFGYGKDDLVGNIQGFLWEINLKLFIERCGYLVDDFIEECAIDDRSLNEPDIPKLFDLGYPSLKDLIDSGNFDLLCELIQHYFYDYIYRGLLGNSVTSDFIINQHDIIRINQDSILIEGKGVLINI